MRKYLLLITVVLISIFWAYGQKKIRVGIFNGNGAAETCVWETKAACGMDKNILPIILSSKDIAKGKLKEVDVLILPGGGGSREYLNLGEQNRVRIKRFVEEGGGLIGICAGAYLASDTPGYSCMRMSGAKAIDIEHDNRGRGVAKVTLNNEGKSFFPEVADRDTLYIMYYEGPVIVPNTKSSRKYKTLGIMESDVHLEGNAPANMTNNRPFFYITDYGKGKVFSTIGHPEATPGMQWMIPKAVHAVACGYKNLKMKVAERFINPNLFNREILMTEEKRRKEEEIFKILLYGDEKSKTEAINWIGENLSWDGKRWLQGLIYDKNREVRMEAARIIEKCMYRYYLRDLQAAVVTEKDKEVRKVMTKAVNSLKP